MPLLAACFGFSGAYFLVETQNQKKRDFKFVPFPYRYIPALGSVCCDDVEFNTAILEAIANDEGKKLSAYELLIASAFDTTVVNTDIKLFSTYDKIFQSSSGLYPVYVSDHYVKTKIETKNIDILGCLKEERCSNHLEGSAGRAYSPNELEYIYNHEIYPQISAVDLSTRIDLDRNIVRLAGGDLGIDKSKDQLVFTGSRFANHVLDKELDYIMILDFVRSPGMYALWVDRTNAYILTNLVNAYAKTGNVINMESYLEKAGTLIKSEGPVECLVKSSHGTGQVFDMQPNEVFVLPLNSEDTVDVMLKNTRTGERLEKKVTGGKVGLIFDTMDSDTLISDDRKALNNCIKFFEVSLKGV